MVPAISLAALSNTLRTVKEFFKGLSRITYKRETTGPFMLLVWACPLPSVLERHRKSSG